MREDFFDDQLEPISPTDSERVRQLANAFSVPIVISIATPGLSLRCYVNVKSQFAIRGAGLFLCVVLSTAWTTR
jgi:hypothetical protein